MGLLALFFFLAGLELKHELVLAVIGTHLPSALRSFLLTLAVVDDLIAIVIIACFYTTGLSGAALLVAVVPLGLFGLLVQRRISHWWLLVPLALAGWALVHASGVHATVAGVVLGLLVPVRRGPLDPDGPTLAERLDRRLRPLSAGVAVPVFAFMAAGVPFLGGGLSRAFQDPITIGIAVALVAGKPAGVLSGTWIVARFTRAELTRGLSWADVLGLALLTGVGFTVSLLIGELAYGIGSQRDAHTKIAVLTGSLLAALLAGLTLHSRNRAYRTAEQDHQDLDGD